MRKIPATMASQHPDHAGIPYWHNKAYITAHHEYKECFLTFSDLDIDEYMWDWEGKLVDESVMERLFHRYYEYFEKHQLGKDKFLTFRLPNPKVETEFRVARAFFSILSAASLAQHMKLHDSPLFEVILPMTETADEMIAIGEAFAEIGALKHALYRLEGRALTTLEIIPLFEKVDTLIDSADILYEYVARHKKKFGSAPAYIRPFIARSDPALNCGLVPTVLAIKIALSKYKEFESHSGVKLFPIIGCASLPFRGGITPHTIEQFSDEYRGVATVVLQSAFRYDYPKTEVVRAVKEIPGHLHHKHASSMTDAEVNILRNIGDDFVPYYKKTVEAIAPTIGVIASCLPKRRERVQHIGLFGYSRGVGSVQLPRAIGFTAALYSLGAPPELIGTGRGLRMARKQKTLEHIETWYRHIHSDLARAGRFVNKDVIQKLAAVEPVWKDVLEDVLEVEKFIGHELAPKTSEEIEHKKLTQAIYRELHDTSAVSSELLTEAGVLRKSLG